MTVRELQGLMELTLNAVNLPSGDRIVLAVGRVARSLPAPRCGCGKYMVLRIDDGLISLRSSDDPSAIDTRWICRHDLDETIVLQLRYWAKSGRVRAVIPDGAEAMGGLDQAS